MPVAQPEGTSLSDKPQESPYCNATTCESADASQLPRTTSSNRVGASTSTSPNTRTRTTGLRPPERSTLRPQYQSCLSTSGFASYYCPAYPVIHLTSRPDKTAKNSAPSKPRPILPAACHRWRKTTIESIGWRSSSFSVLFILRLTFLWVYQHPIMYSS